MASTALRPLLRPILQTVLRSPLDAPLRSISFGPYSPSNPLFVAHRGAALMYPENTMLAFDNAYATGERALETDFALLSDGALVIMHDDTVDRTTDGTGLVSSFDTALWQALRVDADNWFGGGFGNDIPVPFASDYIGAFGGRALLLVDAKNSASGAAMLAAFAAASVPPRQVMVKATALAELSGALEAGHETLLTVGGSTTEIAEAQAAGVGWVGLDISTAADSVFADWIAAGFRVSAFTIRRRVQRDRVVGLGATMLMCDDPAYVRRDTPISTTDNFSAQTWQPGMLDAFNGLGASTRGRFVAPDMFEIPLNAGNFTSVLQGWACPVKSDPNCNDFTMDFKVTFGSTDGGTTTRWASVFMGKTDDAFQQGAAPSTSQQGFHILLRKSGAMQIYKRTTSAMTQVVDQATTLIATAQEVAFRLVVSPTAITMHRLDGSGNITHTATYAEADNAFKGGYIHLCRLGLQAGFRDIAIT